MPILLKDENIDTYNLTNLQALPIFTPPLTDIEFDNAAELRKAVIYTEILNRKY